MKDNNTKVDLDPYVACIDVYLWFTDAMRGKMKRVTRAGVFLRGEPNYALVRNCSLLRCCPCAARPHRRLDRRGLAECSSNRLWAFLAAPVFKRCGCRQRIALSATSTIHSRSGQAADKRGEAREMALGCIHSYSIAVEESHLRFQRSGSPMSARCWRRIYHRWGYRKHKTRLGLLGITHLADSLGLCSGGGRGPRHRELE